MAGRPQHFRATRTTVKSGFLQELGRGLADLWAVVLQEGIVEQDDLPMSCRLRTTWPPGKPVAKRLAGKGRQRTLWRDTELGHGPLYLEGCP